MTFGFPKPLAEMTDRELDDELQRRRRLRAASRRPEAPITDVDRQALARFERDSFGDATGTPAPRSDAAAAVERAELARHYASLELPSGAPLHEVETRYRELMAKYSPDKHAASPDKHGAAVRLVQELTRAYQALAQRLRSSSGR